jgi:ribokinase
MDVVNRVQKHPLPGETIKGLSAYYPGGKGANQAVAASLAGGSVTLIGAVGRDPFGDELISTLQRYGVRTELILRKEGTSGMAFITVDALGENTIILSEGANGKLSVKDVQALLPAFEGADAVLLQNEIPWETTEYAMKEAHKSGIRVFFNPAPADQVGADCFPFVDVMVLNETEAEAITGISVQADDEALQAAKKIIECGAKGVLMTLGAKGALYVQRDGMSFRTPSFRVDAVDTTAAGDAFIGAFTVASLSMKTVEESLRFASAAAAITVAREGAQVSIPNRAEIEMLLIANSGMGGVDESEN